MKKPVLLLPAFALAASVGATAGVAWAIPVTPTTFHVDRFDDELSDAASVCSDAANDCTLRAAVAKANAQDGDDEIRFDSTVFASPQTIELGTEINIMSNLSIRGPVARVTVDGNLSGPVFTVADSTNVSLQRLTLTGGAGANGDDFNTGGGAISNAGSLRVNNCLLTGNGAFFGGAIFNRGFVLLSNSQLENNEAAVGAGLHNHSSGFAFVVNSVVKNNTALTGGGLFNQGVMLIIGSTLQGNQAATDEVGDSKYDGSGGALFNAGQALLLQITVSGNSAAESGGAILNFEQISMSHSTLAGNSAPNGGGISNEGSLDLTHNILQKGQGVNLVNAFEATLNSGGYNFSDDATGPTTGNGDQTNVSGLNLGMLQDNGGPTPTHALLSGSVAINAGDPEFGEGQTDQRGENFPRVVGGRVDIGAFEFGAGDRAPVIKTETLSGVVNVPFSQQIKATDQNGDTVFFKMVDGTLPPGLKLSERGLLSGTPTEVGEFAFTLRVNDQNSKSKAKITVTIAADEKAPKLSVKQPMPEFVSLTREKLINRGVRGTASDEAGLQYVVGQLRRASDGFAWNGTKFVEESNKYKQAALENTEWALLNSGGEGPGDTSYILPPADKMPAGDYFFVIAARDQNGNWQTTAAPFTLIEEGASTKSSSFVVPDVKAPTKPSVNGS